MYLKLLDKTQKELFVEIIYKLAIADGEYSEIEKNLIQEYCKEMNIEVPVNFSNRAIEDILDEFAVQSREREKKIILFEALSLAMIDKRYAEQEKKLFTNLMDKFNIDATFVEKSMQILETYIALQEQINTMIM